MARRDVARNLCYDFCWDDAAWLFSVDISGALHCEAVGGWDLGIVALDSVQDAQDGITGTGSHA